MPYSQQPLRCFKNDLFQVLGTLGQDNDRQPLSYMEAVDGVLVIPVQIESACKLHDVLPKWKSWFRQSEVVPDVLYQGVPGAVGPGWQLQ